MKTFNKILLILIMGLSLLLVSCKTEDKTARDNSNTATLLGILGNQTGTSSVAAKTCFACHTEDSDLGTKIRYAQTGFSISAHNVGPETIMYGFNGTARNDANTSSTAITTTAGNITVTSTSTSGSTSTASTATSVTVAPEGLIQTGSDSWTSIGMSEIAALSQTGKDGAYCQTCHTGTGWAKLVSNGYSTKFSDPYNFQANRYTTAVLSDSITGPTPQDCFTCHKPHTSGTFDRRVPDGATVTTDLGAKYNKNNGNVCVGCHEIRMGFYIDTDKATKGYTDVMTKIWHAVTGVQSVLSASNNNSSGPNLNFNVGTTYATSNGHDAAQADMLMGTAGAHFDGKTYGNSAHTTLADAGCATCHMAIDYANEDEALTVGLGSGNVGGHTFQVSNLSKTGSRSKTINLWGCSTSNCHTVSGGRKQTEAVKAANDLISGATTPRTTSNTSLIYVGAPTTYYSGITVSTGAPTANSASPNNIYTYDVSTSSVTSATASGFIRKTTVAKLIKDGAGNIVNYNLNLNKALKAMADPDKSCGGLLAQAVKAMGGTGTASCNRSFPDGTLDVNINDGLEPSITLGTIAAVTSTSKADTGCSSSNKDACKIAYAKAWWNVVTILRDKSFGVHNNKYATQLAVDSCEALKVIVAQNPAGIASPDSVTLTTIRTANTAAVTSTTSAAAMDCGARP